MLSLSVGEARPWTYAINNEGSSCHAACVPLESWEKWREKGKTVILYLGCTLKSPVELRKTLRCLGSSSRDSDLIGLEQSLVLRGLKVSWVILIISYIEHCLVSSF